MSIFELVMRDRITTRTGREEGKGSSLSEQALQKISHSFYSGAIKWKKSEGKNE